MSALKIIVFLFIVILTSANSARILAYFQIPSPSHHFIFKAIIEEIARRGHDVVYVTPFPYEQPPKGITQIVLRKCNYLKDIGMNFTTMGEYNILKIVYILTKFGITLSEKYLASKEVQALIHSDEKFDAVIMEPYFGQEHLSAFIHKFNAIGIDVVTLGGYSWTNELAGLTDNPSYQFHYRSEVYGNLGFWERLYNTYVVAASIIGTYYTLGVQQNMADKFFNYSGYETRPPIDRIIRNKSLILVNYDPLLGYPYPVAPHRKDIGGINIKPKKPLPEKLQTFMDESKSGVIYMSLGTHVKSTWVQKDIDIFLTVFKELPQRVLLKYEEKYPGEVPPNVKMSKWFPQQDILAHNNCALFITHGGQLSVSEAIYYGLPVVGVPFFVDQTRNVMNLEFQGIGRLLKRRNISLETVSWTVHEVLSNKRYKEEAARRSKMFRDKRHTPSEEAGYWIEHSLKYPYSLTPHSASLTPIQLHLLDVKLFILFVSLLILYSIYVLVHFFKKYLLMRKEKTKIN